MSIWGWLQFTVFKKDWEKVINLNEKNQKPQKYQRK
jgi:hypothetical protein